MELVGILDLPLMFICFVTRVTTTGSDRDISFFLRASKDLRTTAALRTTLILRTFAPLDTGRRRSLPLLLLASCSYVFFS